MAEKNGETYVSFKWMLAQTLALIISIVSIGLLTMGAINSKIDSGLNTKVSMEKFDEKMKSMERVDIDICKLMEQFTNEKKITNDRLSLIEQNISILIGKPIAKSKNNK